MFVQNLQAFLLKHRFSIWDICHDRGPSIQDFEISRSFHGHQAMQRHLGIEQIRRLKAAFIVGGYMADSETRDQMTFSQLASFLQNDEWRYALRFCPYTKVDMALENLSLIGIALRETELELNASKAKMAASMGWSDARATVLDAERKKAASQILTFTTLYSSYVDCTRVIVKSGV